MNPIPIIPKSAPFTAEQRAWLNGFFAGAFGLESSPCGRGQGEGILSIGEPPGAGAPGLAVGESSSGDGQTGGADLDPEPWHDPNLVLDERLALAADRPLADKLMASMAQLDCGQCGYVCRSYSIALAEGKEKSTSLCVPGGKETQRKLKELLTRAESANGPRRTSGEQTSLAPQRVSAKFHAIPNGNGASHSLNGHSRTNSHHPSPKRGHDPKHPILARLVECRRLNREGSAKDTRLVRFAIDETVEYLAGDSLGVFPKNGPADVDHILKLLHCRGDETIIGKDGATRSLRESLTTELDLRSISDGTLSLLAETCDDPTERGRLIGWLNDLPDGIDLIDVLETSPSARPGPARLVEALESLRPRLYSISSSPKAYPHEIHLTVGVVRYERSGRKRNGVASTFLADRSDVGSRVPVFVRASHGFRLPVDSDVPIIMIGPGTGVAPFRAFLQERRATAARGRNWLIFGDQRRGTDFLYEEEWLQYQSDGYLHRLDLAFSRDASERVYVQHRLRENARDVWSWLENGAHVYVCGDAKRMAVDVHKTLIEIVARYTNQTTNDAGRYLSDLAKQGRYQRDVY